MIKAIIVDDEADCCELLAILLERYCPEVEVAAICYSGAEALLSIAKQKPQILFLDVEMPKMNGFELIEKIPEINFDELFFSHQEQFDLDYEWPCEFESRHRYHL